MVCSEVVWWQLCVGSAKATEGPHVYAVTSLVSWLLLNTATGGWRRGCGDIRQGPDTRFAWVVGVCRGGHAAG